MIKNNINNDIDTLKSDIKEKKIRNLYLFYGPEEFLKKHYLENIEKIILTNELKSLNRIVLEGKVEVGTIIDNCETLPVFSERKLVIVKNSGVFKAKGKGKQENKSKGSNDVLLDYILQIPEQTCLIFFEEEIDKRMKAINLIKQKGLVVEFPFQKSNELVKWVIKAVKSNGKEIDMMTASQLVENCEQGMTEILNEINKLVSYASDRVNISGADIQKICTKSVKSRIFDLTDAISGKDTKKALKLLEDMVILKEPMAKVLFMITRQFRQILEMKLLCSSGMRTEEAATKMGIMTFAAGKIQRQSAAFSIDTLKSALKECLDLDISIKTGRIDERIAVELLITEYSKK